MTQVDLAVLGSDGSVGGPGGSPLSPSAVAITTGANYTVAPQRPVFYLLGQVSDDTTALNALLAAGNIHLMLYGTGTISAALVLNSNTTLDLSSATLNVAAHTNDNIVRNASLSGGNSNIAVIGTGHSTAILNGNCQNQDGQSGTNWKNVALLFVKVAGLTLRDFTLQDYNGWGISPQACTQVRVTDIQSVVNNVSFNQGLVNTADGGTDHLYMNLTGNSHDDFVALISRPGAGFSYSGAGGTLSRVVVRNIRGNNGGVGRMLRLLTGDGSQLFHVDVDGVIWEGAGVPADMVILDGSLTTDSPPGYLLTSRPAQTDFFDITIRNVKGGCGTTGAILNVNSPCAKVRFYGTTANTGWNDFISIPSWGTIADLQVLGSQITAAPTGGTDGIVIKNRGAVTNFVFSDSSGNVAFVTVLDNTGGTFTNFVSRGLNHPTCSGAAYPSAAQGTHSNGPDFDWNLGGVAFRRRNNINGRWGNIYSTSGDLTLNSLTWVGVAATTGFDITVSAYAGALVELAIIANLGNEAVQLFLDFATVVSSTLTNVVSTGSAYASGTGVGILQQPTATGSLQFMSGSWLYTVAQSDIVPLHAGDSFGTVTFRPIYRQGSATNQTYRRSAAQPSKFWAKVL
jgi:hypothetical protein